MFWFKNSLGLHEKNWMKSFSLKRNECPEAKNGSPVSKLGERNKEKSQELCSSPWWWALGEGWFFSSSLFQTQPVPNPIAYFMHRSPWWFHQFETLVNHFIELVVPFFLFLGRRMCIVHGVLQILFQVRCSWVWFLRVTSSPRTEQGVFKGCRTSPAARACCPAAACGWGPSGGLGPGWPRCRHAFLTPAP